MANCHVLILVNSRRPRPINEFSANRSWRIAEREVTELRGCNSSSPRSVAHSAAATVRCISPNLLGMNAGVVRVVRCVDCPPPQAGALHGQRPEGRHIERAAVGGGYCAASCAAIDAGANMVDNLTMDVPVATVDCQTIS